MKLFAIDTETTGLDPFQSKLMSLALVDIDDPENRIQLFVDHDLEDLDWTPAAWQFFQNYQTDWENQKMSMWEIGDKLKEFIGDEIITPVMHNAAFDMGFLKQLPHFMSLNISHRCIDTASLLIVFKQLGLIGDDVNSSFDAFNFYNIFMEENERHTALGDALATRELYLRMMTHLSHYV